VVFEDVEIGMADFPAGTVKVSIVPEHAPGLSEEQLRASPAAMWAKLLVHQYEIMVKLLGGRIHEPGDN